VYKAYFPEQACATSLLSYKTLMFSYYRVVKHMHVPCTGQDSWLKKKSRQYKKDWQ